MIFLLFSFSKTIANVLRDRVQLEQLRRRMPQDHSAFNRSTALLEVNHRKKEILQINSFVFLEHKMAKLKTQNLYILLSDVLFNN
jgi:hypothetical protein